jgi:hydroxyacylglutathione hydrolase
MNRILLEFPTIFDGELMDTVITIPALGDNLIYVVRCEANDAFVVDPGDASPVLRTLKEHSLNLKAILLTHHHWDHTAGAGELKRKTGCEIVAGYGKGSRDADKVVEGGEILEMGNARIEVLTTPGHTRTSVCYYMQPSGDTKNGMLWTGDTLFVGGCGRLFECDPQTMWQSLQKLASLPGDTLVYCGHDYTVENYEFALSIEPGNKTVRQRLDEVKYAIRQSKQTVPSSLSQEKATNPFLRADAPEMKAALGMASARAVEVFAELRRRKDVF